MTEFLRLSTITIFMLLTSMVTAQSFKNANEYLDFVGSEQENITKNMWKYTKAMAHSKNDRAIESKRSELIKSVSKAINKIEKAENFGDHSFKEQVLDHLRLNENLLNQDYANIIDLKEVAEQSYDMMEAYVMAQELANQKMEDAYNTFNDNLKKYAKDNNIQIIENHSDLAKKMKISNEVFAHYNKMHLLHFKVNINEVYLTEAIEKNDANAIQQSANALSQTAKEGVESLSSVNIYKNDTSLIEVTKKAFEFYIDEAEKYTPTLTDFLILNQDFETIKTSLEKTPERKRTKEQVDAYNKKVKELNKAVGNYNKTISHLNRERQAIINNLNNANANFLSKHIPND